LKEIMEINNLAHICGYFESKTGVNNGYGCKHPNQQESEETEVDEEIKECGKCFAFSCPLAYQADYEDCKEIDSNSCTGCNKEDCENGEYESCELVVVEKSERGDIIPSNLN